jgi:hypothetical protein
MEAIVTADGLAIGGHLFNRQVPLEQYREALGVPHRTIAAGPPAPTGHRSNQVHIFDSQGIYLTEHHASRLIESVNFVFDPSESPFPIAMPFMGSLTIDGRQICSNMLDTDLDPKTFARVLGGEYSVSYKNCWIGVSTKRRGPGGKRGRVRHVTRASVCF